MRCADVRRLSTRYLEGELAAARASAVRGHLRDCATCRLAVEDEDRIAAAARQLADPPEPPGGWDSLRRRIDVRLAEEERTDAARSRWALWWRGRGRVAMATLSAAAAVAIAFALSSQILPAPGSVRRAANPAPATPRSPAEGFLDRAEREIVRADRRYVRTIEDLRRLVDAERPHWPVDRADALDAKLTELDERAAEARGRLAVMGTPEPHARDELYEVYREQIALLQRAAVGAPLAAASPPEAGGAWGARRGH